MNNTISTPFILALDDCSATLELVGGKGASLARMAAAGLPVPGGFHITTEAYWHFVTENSLQEPILAAVAVATAHHPATYEEASHQIQQFFSTSCMPRDIADALRHAYAKLGNNLPVAVRSSATAEDLPDMSFAGQQESFLNIVGEEALLDAVKRCWASLWTARAMSYRARHDIAPEDVRLAVVVQELVPAETAGILFTANPLTGARGQMVINAAWGLGEAIVGGQVTPDTVVIDRTGMTVAEQHISTKEVMTVRTSDGTHEEAVPDDKRTAAVLDASEAMELARIGVQIEGLYDQPMDIEWARHDGRFFVVQARPITTLRDKKPTPEEWNDSLLGNFLWTSNNVGEAIPDVMTPCTWSLLRIFAADAIVVTQIDGHPMIGNIGGHFYMNVSALATLAGIFGLSKVRFAETIQQTFGRIPKGLDIPLVPVSRWRVLRTILPVAVRLRLRVRANQKRIPAFVATAPAQCDTLHARIAATSDPHTLVDLWHREILPFFRECNHMLEAGARLDGTAIVWTRRALSKLVDEADTNALLSGLSSKGEELASLGLLVGFEKLARGEIDRATFAQQYGHRGPHEFELSLPRPGEDPHWIDKQLVGLRESSVNVTTLLARQKKTQEAAWNRLVELYPRKAPSIRRKIDRAATAFRYREAARSEVIRAIWVIRAFMLRVGAMTGVDDDIFFLSIEEVLALLDGDTAALAHVPSRRAAYDRYVTLPPYPAFICGPFDPFRWAADPQRRSDLFDARGSTIPASDTITGFPGAEGVVEGRARVIAFMEQGDQLQSGEILVTTVTNVGWTPLFPRVAAVVTDVGAPLSHAAIVARELGIPAVVGCGNATMRLHTGDLVRVDGGRGTVEVVQAVGS